MSKTARKSQSETNSDVEEYFNKRMSDLGITDEENRIGLWTGTSYDSAHKGENVLESVPIFRAGNTGIDILVYTLDRHRVRYAAGGKGPKNRVYMITRLYPEQVKEDGKRQKYDMPAGQPTMPFFPPVLIQKFEEKTLIPVLYITEGYFKAFKAGMHGIDCVGIPSITLWTERETRELYNDVKRLIEVCKVQRIVWLMDGDCQNLSAGEIISETDISKRPNGFYRSVISFIDLLSDYREIDKYFAHINSDSLTGNPKGLDDLLITLQGKGDKIAKEFNSFARLPKDGIISGTYLTRVKITENNKSSVYKYFHLNDVDSFFQFHLAKRPDLLTVPIFKFKGKSYTYIADENKCLSANLHPEPIQKALEAVKKLCKATKWDNDGRVKDISISRSNFNELLYTYGFRRFDVAGNNSIMVKDENNVLEHVAPVQVQDAFFSFIEQLPDELHDGISKYLLKEYFTKDREKYFSPGNLSLLKNNRTFDFCRDTRSEVFIFYKNGFVKCEPGSWNFHPLTELNKYIWKNQIIDREFSHSVFNISNPGCFGQFVLNVCGKNHDRFYALCTMIGYALHGFYETKLKAIILTDSEINENPSGRTGKGLLLQALRRIKPTEVINGKDFKTEEKFKYQAVALDTQVVGIDDAKNNFKIDDLFNDIVEGPQVEKKNQAPFKTKVKFLITTNKTIKIEGASAKDRVLMFEMSEHYSDKFSPQDEFGKWFFSEFDNSDWQAFDNFMCFCIALYLDKGVLPVATINLERRTLLEHTNTNFVEWMDDLVNSGNIQVDIDYDKKELYTQFLTAYPDYTNNREPLAKQKTFTAYLKMYINKSPHFAPYEKAPGINERRSNGRDYIIFRAKKEVA